MPAPEHVVRFWRALDDLFGEVRPAWWGAVVADARFPAISDANYARIDVAAPDLRAADIEAELLPALASVGARVMHAVSFDPEGTSTLLTELSTRGHRLTFDLVMDRDTVAVDGDYAVTVEDLTLADDLWEHVATSIALFGVDDEVAADQLLAIERDVLAPGGKRWFGVRDEGGRVVSVGALVTLEGVGYVDDVATVPDARGRGFASAIVRRVVREARAAGADRVFLLVDPDAEATVRIYERIGFGGVARLAATRGPIPAPDGLASPSADGRQIAGGAS